MTDKITRRTLGGLAAAGLGAPMLGGCGDESRTPASDGRPSSTPRQSTSAPVGTASGGAAPVAFTRTEDIPVGGGTIFPDEEVVVTQPTKGEFKCFTAICSHAGCIVTDVSETIFCDCHESEYDIETGDVIQGPATFPLAEIDITVTGDQISLA